MTARMEVVNGPEVRHHLTLAAIGIPIAMEAALRAEADKVVGESVPQIPVLTGRAAASVKIATTGHETTITAGTDVPYWHWLRFGGAVGRAHAVRRPVVAEGRYFPARVAMERRFELAGDAGVKAGARLAGF